TRAVADPSNDPLEPAAAGCLERVHRAALDGDVDPRAARSPDAETCASIGENGRAEGEGHLGALRKEQQEAGNRRREPGDRKCRIRIRTLPVAGCQLPVAGLLLLFAVPVIPMVSLSLAPTGRLAPTPSGHLHLGNALAFGAAWLSVRGAGG